MTHDSETPKTARSKLTFGKITLGLMVLVLVLGLSWFAVFNQAETPAEVFRHFRNAERIEFCTIVPELPRAGIAEDFGYGNIEGYAIVDRVFLKNQRSTINALAWADRVNNHSVASCFNPRHAIRDENDRSNYLLICFECSQMKYSLNGESGTALISDSQVKFFDKLVEIHSMTQAADLRVD